MAALSVPMKYRSALLLCDLYGQEFTSSHEHTESYGADTNAEMTGHTVEKGSMPSLSLLKSIDQ
jgi:hypothetical protein